MTYRTVATFVTVAYLMALPGGCSSTAQSYAPENSDIAGGNIQFEVVDNDHEVVYNNGLIADEYPNDDEAYFPPEETEAPRNTVTLPDGTSAEADRVKTQDDGTVIVTEDHGHKCFYTDGSYLVTNYSDSNRTVCGYEEAAHIYALHYFENGELWKEEWYDIAASGEPILFRSFEHEYTHIEIGTEDSAVYRSATVETFYDEFEGDYKTCRSEYDSLHGPDKPYKCTYYDGTYSLHEYNLDGSKERDEFYYANGVMSQLDTYENGVMVMQFLFWEDGSKNFETYYEDGVITLEIYHSESGSYTSSTYYENGIRYRKIAERADGSQDTAYYDENGNTEMWVFNGPGGTYEGKAIYENYPDGSPKTITYYDENDQVTEVEEYDQNGNIIS